MQVTLVERTKGKAADIIKEQMKSAPLYDSNQPKRSKSGKPADIMMQHNHYVFNRKSAFRLPCGCWDSSGCRLVSWRAHERQELKYALNHRQYKGFNNVYRSYCILHVCRLVWPVARFFPAPVTCLSSPVRAQESGPCSCQGIKPSFARICGVGYPWRGNLCKKGDD